MNPQTWIEIIAVVVTALAVRAKPTVDVYAILASMKQPRAVKAQGCG